MTGGLVLLKVEHANNIRSRHIFSSYRIKFVQIGASSNIMADLVTEFYVFCCMNVCYIIHGTSVEYTVFK